MTPFARGRGGGAAELRVILCLLALAAALLAVELWPRSDQPPLPAPEQIAAMEAAWQELLLSLPAEAELAADRVHEVATLPLDSAAARRTVFEELDRISFESGRTLVLVDPDDQAQAWGGPGLRHDLPLDRLLPGAVHQTAGFTAVTLYAVVDMSAGESGWRLVVGVSHATDALPIETPFGLRRHGVRWSVRDHSTAPPSRELAAAGMRELAPPFGLRRHGVMRELAPPFGLRRHGVMRELAPPFGLRRHGVMRELAPPDDLSAPWLRLRFEPAAARGPGIAAALAFALAALAAGLLLAWAFRRWLCRRSGRPRLAAAVPVLLGIAAAVGYGLYRWQLHATDQAGAPPDLGSSFGGPPGIFGASGIFGAPGSFGALGSFGAEGGAFWLEVGNWTVLLAAWVLLAGAGLWAAGWRDGRDWMHVLLIAAAAAALVGLLAEAACWPALRAAISERVGNGADGPTPEEAAALERRASSFLAGSDLAALALGDPNELDDHQDLGLELWRRSPLAASGTHSALAVIRDGEVLATFSYGLPVDAATGELAKSSARWPRGDLPAWQERRSVSGEVPLLLSGRQWAVARYWTTAFPVLDLWNGDASGIGSDLELRLLRGGPGPGGFGGGRLGSWGLPGTALRVWVDGAGRPLVSPWQEDWMLPPPSEAVDPSRTLRVETPAGPALAWFSASGEEDLWVVALLLEHSVPERLWRVATVAARLILALAVVAFAIFLIGLPAAKLRGRLLPDVRRYSVRLAAVLALIAIVPLTLLNGLLFRNLGARIQVEQEAAGRAALVSLEYVLTEILLSLEPGFSMNAQLDDDLLAWLAEAVEHEVNLYWRGSVYASSKPDLFTAGLMPKRIPGAVYSRLVLHGHPTTARVQTAGGSGVSYLELYMPVSLGEERPGESGLFVSVPLLAQQEAATLEFAALGRQALVVATALVLLLVVVGVRLARGFARPLMQMIAGADRIAGGAAALGFEPRETELRTLAAAIDSMAARIASNRAREEEAQRLEAWAEMARLIAHEVKNPLTPIRLSTQHLRQVWRDAPERLPEIFERCTDNILLQVDELARTAGEFSTYSRIPLARFERGDLVAAVREVVDGYRHPMPSGARVVFESRVGPHAARLPFDRRLLQRAVRNLLENALCASERGGEVRVTVAPVDGGPAQGGPAQGGPVQGGALAVTVADRGRGVSDTDLERIFEPYFSTSSGGTGLGAPIARRIVEEHGGTITASRRAGGGLSLRIVLPANQASPPGVGAADADHGLPGDPSGGTAGSS